MTRKTGKTMSTLSPERVDISTGEISSMSTPCETRMNTWVSEENAGYAEETDVYPTQGTGVDIIPENVGAKKAAELLGIEPRSVNRNCESGKYQGATKVPVNGVEVWQIPIGSLPERAQRKILEEVKATARERAAAQGLHLPTPEDLQRSPAEYSIIWEDYERSGESHKRRATAALEALDLFQRIVDTGSSIGEAEKEVASRHGVSKPTLWRYRTRTKNHPRLHWLPLLSPRYKGGRPLVEFTDAAYEYIRGRSLTTSETPLAVLIQEAREIATANGWTIPSDDAIRGRLNKEPKWVATMGRKGPKALERSYPAIQKNYESLALHELWESDGRKSDVFCVWPDGTIARPFIIVWQEVRSRLVLGVKGFLNPSAAGVLAAFGMAMERAQTAPDFAKIDNGREYASKLATGGQKTRYRFKVVPGEQPGIMTQVGTNAEWSPPGRGQDKPIESFWRFVADRCDKAPEFEGAYCGRNPVVKPENFDRKKAIPLADYSQKLAAVMEFFNNQHRHTGSGMNGRTPMEVYTELSWQTARNPIDPAHIRLCKMGAAYIKPDKDDASYTLKIPGPSLTLFGHIFG
jgi:putative transposase